MAIITDPKSPFDFAYKGFQYPLPPSWKYAVRQQDQIYWLLQAILLLDDNGIDKSELEDAIDSALRYVNSQDARLSSRIDALQKGWYAGRNPVTGMYDFGYVIYKQMYDMLRVYACTWDELAETGMTWNELKATGYSWFEVDLFGNLYWGNGDIRAKYTPREHVDWMTPGFDFSCWPWPLNPDEPGPGPGPDPEPEPEPTPDPGENLTTWASMKAYGFLIGDAQGKQVGRTWDDIHYHGFKYYSDGQTLVTGTTWNDVLFHGFAVK